MCNLLPVQISIFFTDRRRDLPSFVLTVEGNAEVLESGSLLLHVDEIKIVPKVSSTGADDSGAFQTTQCNQCNSNCVLHCNSDENPLNVYPGIGKVVAVPRLTKFIPYPDGLDPSKFVIFDALEDSADTVSAFLRLSD